MQLALYEAGEASRAGKASRESEAGRESTAGKAGGDNNASNARTASNAGEASRAPHSLRGTHLLPRSPHQPHSPYSPQRPHSPQSPAICAACQAREARYGFRNAGDDPTVDRPRTLCFDCFRMEMDRRRSVAAQLARGWDATQTELPLADRLEALARRRGRAQIAARHALNLR